MILYDIKKSIMHKKGCTSGEMLLEKILEEDSSYVEDLRNNGMNSYHSDKRLANGHHATPNVNHHYLQQQQHHLHHHTGSVHVTNI